MVKAKRKYTRRKQLELFDEEVQYCVINPSTPRNRARHWGNEADAIQRAKEILATWNVDSDELLVVKLVHRVRRNEPTFKVEKV